MDNDLNNRSEEKNVSDDLDKTANIINLQSSQKSGYKQQFNISPRKLQKSSMDFNKQFSAGPNNNISNTSYTGNAVGAWEQRHSNTAMGMTNTSAVTMGLADASSGNSGSIIKAGKGHGLKQMKKLEIDISSSPITKSWQHSKQMSFNNFNQGSNEVTSQLSRTMQAVGNSGTGPLGLIETGEIGALREPGIPM